MYCKDIAAPSAGKKGVKKGNEREAEGKVSKKLSKRWVQCFQFVVYVILFAVLD